MMVKGWHLPQWLGVSTPTVGGANTLVCDALGFGYQGEPLHSPLSVRFEQGLVHGVLGENGSGKSCLVKTLAGLVKPLAGRVELSCSDTEALLSAGQRHEVVLARRNGWQGYLEQQAQVHWNLSVYEVVALGASARRDWSPAARAAAVEDALVACDCQALASRPVLQLSTGERQRVMLARVLAAKPQVLLVDEPTAGLDPRHQHGIMQLLRAQASAGAIVIAVMHDIALTRRYCDTALLLSGCKDRSRCLNLSFAGWKDRSQCLNLSSVHGEQCKNQAPGANLAFGPVAEVLTDAAVRRVFGIG